MSQAQVPNRLRHYFGPVVDTREGHPLIRQVFYPDRGWRSHPLRKRVSGNELRKLRREGATHVGVSLPDGAGVSDWSIKELLSTMPDEDQRRLDAKARQLGMREVEV